MSRGNWLDVAFPEKLWQIHPQFFCNPAAILFALSHEGEKSENLVL